MSKILKLEQWRPDAALKNLNRVTGLDFDSWPESLLVPEAHQQPSTRPVADHQTPASGCAPTLLATRQG